MLVSDQLWLPAKSTLQNYRSTPSHQDLSGWSIYEGTHAFNCNYFAFKTNQLRPLEFGWVKKLNFFSF